MEGLSEYVLLLATYHALFFWRVYTNIFRQSTSEVISTFFPHWIWAGRQWAKGKLPMKDQIYYQYPGCIPFLSTFYPLGIVSSFLSTFLRLDTAFLLWQYVINLHYLLGSILSFLVFSQWASVPLALFGALTLTYASFMIKIQPCVVYTIAWLPGTLLDGPLQGISVAGALLGGYWPYCVYFLPVSLMATFLWERPLIWFLLGVLFSLPQIIPFLWYLPQSVRAKKTGNPGKFGIVPISRFLNLIKPDNYTTYVGGLLSQESTMFIGWIPLLFIPFSQSQAWWLLPLSALGMLGVVPSIGRISARWSYLFVFSLVWLAVSGMSGIELPWTTSWALLLLQAFTLLINRRQLSYWPFTEWWKKPSEFWGARPNQEGTVPYNPAFPYFTGYITASPTPGYTGGFALQRLHDKYGIKDPNGERVKSFHG